MLGLALFFVVMFIFSSCLALLRSRLGRGGLVRAFRAFVCLSCFGFLLVPGFGCGL